MGGSNAHDTALSAERRGDIEIALHIERQALRTAKAAIEDCSCSVRIDGIDGIEAGSRRSGDIEIAIRPEGKMIGRNAGLERREDEDLTVARDLENGAAAIANVQVLLMIKGDA